MTGNRYFQITIKKVPRITIGTKLELVLRTKYLVK